MSAILGKLVLQSPHLKSHVKLPPFIYGTAWKKEATAALVYEALTKGFTAIDTAAQPKHYREDLVAAGIGRAIKDGKIRRSDLYLQTKFTSIQGQDLNAMPYDTQLPLSGQVSTSVISSLKNFNFGDVTGPDDNGEPYIDTLVLHSPLPTMGETLEVWQTLEQFVPGEIRNLGISNCDLFTLMELWERATIKPAVVQNRFYSDTKYDIGVRRFCDEHGIIYQAFWTLSANPSLLRSLEVRQLAEAFNISPQAALYCLVLGLENIVILNGTTNTKHMVDDLAAIELMRTASEEHQRACNALMLGFKARIGQLRG